ncbi:glycosyltransferase family 32 protein [Leeuwenhoekiella sp. LLG6367-2.1]|uniref:glycosyltransferase family 32 protein n=1 Tax=Leeuwenhoekiella sp. LLG6367-2.1 TaxID=3160833 RepID=UPI0038679CAC
MIPRIIHYCWFGGGKKSDFINYCISTWKFYLTDYQFIEWNEQNFDVSICEFTRQAYSSKQWAFLSDYVRSFALIEYGGVYLDTDVELKSSLDIFLNHRAFSGFENIGFPFTAVWGAEKGHIWPRDIKLYYEDLGKLDFRTNTCIVSDYLIEKYNVNPLKNEFQELKDGIQIYPSYYFCLDPVPNYAVHHFTGSWLEKGDKSNYSENLLKPFFKERLLNYYKDDIIGFLYNEGIINRLEIKNFLIKRFLKKFKSIWKV